MKITFIHNGYESLAIESLSAALKKEGFETSLVIDPLLFNEPGFWRIKPLARAFDLRREAMLRLEADRPDLVCFSVFTDTFQWALGWARTVKKELGVPVVFGGIHPTSVPEKVITRDCVDYVCVGEGDRALPELAAALASGREPSVPNIWRKKNGAVLKGPMAAPENPDSLEFPDKEIFYGRYPFFNHGYLAAAGRGCPFSCAYCANSVYSRLYGAGYARKRSPDRVIEELSMAKTSWRPGFIHFADEVFNWDTAWLETFLPRYKKEIHLPFSCFIYPDLLDANSARLLKEAGCFKVQLGVQTFDGGRRREILKRTSDNKKIAAAIDLLRREGVYTVCDSILGLPGDTGEDLLNLAGFYAEHTPDQNEVFFLKYYPGTELTIKASEDGLLKPEELAAIEAGEGPSGIISRPADTRPELNRFFSLLLMLPLIPAAMKKRLIRSAFLIKLLPGNILLRIMTRLLRRPAYDFNTGQFVRIYRYFMALKFKGLWQKLF
ncbi:MAG: B12-binding domain-containing radical SAM protein [Elusimicrobia bacterium]|nr:B12-binding domain-containing radical SAM protein [Elusimicrobiota bacterium]